MSEIHIFIIWEKAKEKKATILADIRQNFIVLQTFEIDWSEEKFSRNLLRLYGNSLKKASSKKIVCGSGPFLFIVVKDMNPKYLERMTLHGEDKVNVNIFDKKIEYRKIAGGGQRVHASNSEKEADRAIGLILNKSSVEFKEIESENSDIIKIKNDLVGSEQWNSLEEFFSILNQSIKYVVLRNFEELPHSFKTGFEGDIDILVEDKNEIELISNANKISPQNFGRRFSLLVNGKKIHFDFRYIGDGYFDEKWEKEIISKRIFSNGIFVPDENNHFYSLLYHCLIHKKSMPESHVKKLREIGKKIGKDIGSEKIKRKESIRNVLEDFLEKNDFVYNKPTDMGVFFDHLFVNQSKRIKIVKNSKIKEKHTPTPIRLIQSSFFILKSEGIKSLFQAAKAKLGK